MKHKTKVINIDSKLLSIVIVFTIFMGCAQKTDTHMVIHVSRILADGGQSYFEVQYDDGAVDLVEMQSGNALRFARERDYHRSMNPELWDQAWEETRGQQNSWQSFKDRYVDLGGTMLFD